MQLTSTESPIVEKTRELCQTILDHPDFQSIRINIDSFMSNDTAKNDYQNLMEKGEELNHKQQQGVRLSPEEISQYEAQRDKVVNNPLSAAFIQAQQEVQEIQQSINTYLSKTLELGRVPSADELGGGGCGSGCGCHH
jgi:cell fate (sporulation/competence/biofilm development) regulator YlbF (YheA/YmcA/DUF963 family)